MADFRKHKGVIFDLDGTLVDSRLDFAAMRRDLGLKEKEPILEALARLGEAEARAGHAVVLRHEMAGAERAVLMPGVEALVARMREGGLKIGIFTRNARAVTERTLAKVALAVDHVVAREDAPPKPDPSGLLDICRAWGCEADEVLYVGDYLYDLAAGRNAGIRTVLYAPGVVDFEHDCADVIEHFAELWRFLE